MSALQPLPPEDVSCELVFMLTPTRAVDNFLGDLTRRSRSKTGRTTYSYRILLDKFTDSLRQDIDVSEITPDDCRRFLDRYLTKSPGYQSVIHSTLNSFLEWLYQQQRIKRNPLDHVTRSRRIPARDLDVTTVSTADVGRLMDATRTESERMAIAILAYLGPRRGAVAMLRVSDYDAASGHLRFFEKGSKTIWKPVPDELVTIIDSAIARGALNNPWQPDDPYLVPPEGALVRAERDDRVIWRIVKRVADHAGIDAHVHALRAAFAVFYLESNGRDIIGLQELMGHQSIETTRIYARRLDRQASMEPVRSLSWGAVTGGNAVASLSSEPAVGDLEADLLERTRQEEARTI